jgi:hypothetical protein
MDLLDQYYGDIAEHYEQRAQSARERQRSGPQSRGQFTDEPEPIEEAKRLFSEGYRFQVDFNFIHSVESVGRTESPLVLIGFKTQKPDGDEQRFSMQELWIGDIEAVRAGDVSPVIDDEFLVRLRGSERAPEWLKDLAESYSQERRLHTNSIFFYLHLLTKYE